MNNLTDMDPLNYEYAYGNYEHLQNPYYNNVKMEPLHQPFMPPLHNLYPPQMPQYPPAPTNFPNNDRPTEMPVTEPVENQPAVEPQEEIDTKEHIKLLPMPKKRKSRAKGKTSSYWNKKISDANFPFYGCTICNLSYQTINELDQHVTIHKGRLTSYDVRLRNQLKRKEKKKQLKKLKKLGKLGKDVKKEDIKFDVEIKPEEGYIGNEEASKFNENIEGNNENANQNQINEANTSNEDNGKANNENSNQNQNNESHTTKEGNGKDANEKKKSEKEKEDKSDPRLQKLFKCFACQKQFSLSYYLKLHVRSHTDEKPYTCAECGQSFITASKLGRHNKRIHLAIRFQCRICYRFFSRFDILTRHFDKAHKEEKLEGEPYDYNAILPYLKELEQELREKEEQKSECKTKTEDWPDLKDEFLGKEEGVKKEDVITFGSHSAMVDDNSSIQAVNLIEQPIEDVIIEEAKVYEETAGVVIKMEKLDDETPLDDHFGDDFAEPSGKDESFSDEDYFPSNTWAATPKIELETEPAPVKKKRGKSSFPNKCEICDKTINSASYYKVHLRTHTGERPFKCYVCNKAFITSSRMHRHVLTHGEQFDESDDLPLEPKQESQEVKTETEGEESTGVKKKRRKGKNAIKVEKGSRRRKQHQKRPHACPYCNKRFLHLSTLHVHKKNHEGEELVLKCQFCLTPCADESALQEHEATHSGPRPYLCTICNRTYTKKETMVYHRKTHEGENGEKKAEFICDICSKTFNAQCKLQRHIVSHRTDKFVLRYECPVCAHMFHTKYHIQMHLTTHQKEGLILEENRPDILAMVMQNARKIPQRSDAVHNTNFTELLPADERSRVCNICGQVFHHFYYLEEHLKSHGSKIAIEDDTKEEEKKHICPVCNKGFKLHYYLKLHSFTHSKEKPFICQQCGKGFITKGKLKRHLETHSGLKKYQCHICYKFFTRPSYLRIHVRTIHGTQDYNFRMDKQFLSLNQSV